MLMMADKTYKVPFMTPDERARFERVFFLLDLQRYTRSPASSTADGVQCSAYFQALFCMIVIRPGVFTRNLVNTTLEIYHDAKEWLPILYGLCLRDPYSNIIVEEVNNSPQDMAAVTLNILVETEAEMRRQITNDFAYIPDLPEPGKSSKVFLTNLYQRALIRFPDLLERLAQRRLLL